ncbi:hypothetical protein [Paraflavitalea sp. CAU 1676]|uniref:hypothetical protein n=1 Tax=Paraflavitalea sp. CAU 1676 TaxID=3032598 RepID=UPI0023D98F03|nr:hypothetical protein [Paraflavitalea sp. CAU 1676]MDF2193203.1 hypothetical protein [Paraflavitalea sp. CAU 1676]
MTLSRNAFFLLLLIIGCSPFIIWKLVWLSKTTVTNGKVWYNGHTLELDGSISTHLVVLFKAGNDSISFNAPTNIPFKEGDAVSVRYVKNEPSAARVNTPLRIWGDTLVYSLWPTLVLLVIYFLPNSLDPIVPRKSKIRLTRRKFVEIVQPEVQVVV